MIRIELMLAALLVAVLGFTGLMVHDHAKWKAEGIAQQKQADAVQFALDADTLAKAVVRVKEANTTISSLRDTIIKKHEADAKTAAQQQQQNAQALAAAQKSDAELLAENRQWMDRYHKLLTDPHNASEVGVGVLKQQLPEELWEY